MCFVERLAKMSSFGQFFNQRACDGRSSGLGILGKIDYKALKIRFLKIKQKFLFKRVLIKIQKENLFVDSCV
jgi:hypothetical protein